MFGSIDRAGLEVELLQPRLGGAYEVYDLQVLPVMFQSGQVGVEGGRSNVVEERQMLANISTRPVREERVQQTLVATIKAAAFLCEGDELAEGVG